MKNNLKFIIILCVLALGVTTVFGQAKKKANKDTEAWRYEIEVVGEGRTGTYLIKVWTYSKKPKVAIAQSKKNAIHGVIFKGFTGKDRLQGQAALASPDVEDEKSDYFDSFFGDGGKYLLYISETNDGAIASEDIMKVGKEYKIGVVVSVNVAGLRKELEQSKIIRSLSSGF